MGWYDNEMMKRELPGQKYWLLKRKDSGKISRCRECHAILGIREKFTEEEIIDICNDFGSFFNTSIDYKEVTEKEYREQK